MRRHNLYTRYQVGIIRPIEDVMGSACSSHGGDGNAYKILIGKHEGKRPLRRLRRRWDDIIEERGNMCLRNLHTSHTTSQPQKTTTDIFAVKTYDLLTLR
jgi:hypothetical protein